MKLTNDGGPAFPQFDIGADSGMTLRDHFAGLALCSYLSGHASAGQLPDPADAAEESVEYADALIARLRTTVARTEAQR